MDQHLARQLEMEYRYRDADDVHDTLVLVLRILDGSRREWPPPDELEPYVAMAHEATKNLDRWEVYAMLLAGAPRWRQARVDCTIADLPYRLQPILERGLGGELERVVARWRGWDIPGLRDGRAVAVKAKKEAEEAEQAAVRERSRVPRRLPRPGELADENPRQGWFQPRGRT